MSTIRIVDYELLEESDEKTPSSAKEPRRDRWVVLHDAVIEVLSRHGKVGSREGVDFYYTGDWFDEHVDAFSLMSAAKVSVRLLRELQRVLVRHDPAATLILEADPGSRLWGLEIYVRAASVDVGWYESDAATCSRLLRKHGLDLVTK